MGHNIVALNQLIKNMPTAKPQSGMAPISYWPAAYFVRSTRVKIGNRREIELRDPSNKSRKLFVEEYRSQTVVLEIPRQVLFKVAIRQ